MPSINATVSLRSIVRQAEDDEIHLLHQRAFGARVLALVLGDAFHHDVALLAKALLNAEARRSGCAIDKDGGLRGGADRPRLIGVESAVMARSFRAGSFRL